MHVFVAREKREIGWPTITKRRRRNVRAQVHCRSEYIVVAHYMELAC